MKIFRFLFLAFLLLFFEYAIGQTALTTSNLNLRNTPSRFGNVLTVIPRTSTVNVENCDDGWCKVTFSGIQGYVRESYLRKTSNSQPSYNNQRLSSVKYYTNSFGEKVQSPTFYNSAPAGATAECNDGTYSFSHSRRGTCSRHGGVRRWL